MKITDGHFRHILLYYFRKVTTQCKLGTEVDDDKMKAMIENNRRSTTREIGEKLNISHTRSVRKVSGLPLYLRADLILHHRAGGIFQSNPHLIE